MRGSADVSAGGRQVDYLGGPASASSAGQSLTEQSLSGADGEGARRRYTLPVSIPGGGALSDAGERVSIWHPPFAAGYNQMSRPIEDAWPGERRAAV